MQLDQKRALLILAKKTIEGYLTGGKVPFDKQTVLMLHPEFNIQVATFVTITIDGRLRGCIGSLAAHRPLLDDVVYNAHAAAFKDRRFKPLSMEEYIKAKIEVSILTPPKAVEFKGKRDLKKLVRPKEDGVILQVGDKRATYLPSVWEQIPDFNEFFTSLATKAGIEGDPFKQSPVVYLYQTEKFKEA